MTVWPEVTIKARNQEEVDCLVRALRKVDLASLVRPGFTVEAGGAHPERILSVVQDCLSQHEIESVNVVLRTGGSYELRTA